MLIAVLIATDSATRVGMYDVFAAEGLRSAKTSDDQGLVFACAQRQPPEVALQLKQALIDRQVRCLSLA
jgi:hypothetical protein